MRKHVLLSTAVVLTVAVSAAIAHVPRAHATFPGRNGLIAFSAEDGNATDQIYVMNPDGTGVRQITHARQYFNGCEWPSLAPSDGTVVFVRQNMAGGEVWSIATTSARLRELSSRGEAPVYSPDRKHIAFIWNGQLWLMRAGGSHQHRLPCFRGTKVSEATFSPNGTTIAFVAWTWVRKNSPQIRSAIYAVDLDGSHLRRLAYTTPWRSYATTPTFGVSFSPDGRRVAYGAWGSHVAFIGIMNADGSGRHVLVHSWGFQEPCFSPDGSKIVCLSGKTWQVFVATAAGRQWHRLTHFRYGVGWHPDWGPHPR